MEPYIEINKTERGHRQWRAEGGGDSATIDENGGVGALESGAKREAGRQREGRMDQWGHQMA